MPIKINELNPGMREDRTTAEIVQIATTLADDELIICNTFLTPTIPHSAVSEYGFLIMS